MSKQVTLNIRVTTVGDGFNHTDVFQVVNNAAAPSAYQSVPAATFLSFGPPAIPGVTGNGTVLVPPRSTSGQPSSSGVSKTLIGNAADLGIPLDPASPVVLFGAGLGVTYGATENVAAIYF